MWISTGGLLHHGAALNKYSPITYAAMARIANHFPCFHLKHKNVWPLNLDFDKIIGGLVSSNYNGFQEIDFSTKIDKVFSLKGHYGTLTNDENNKMGHYSNIGDEIQSFPGLQFYPFVDHFIDRETFSSFKLNEGSTGNVTLFLNGWYGMNVEKNWPPVESLDPLIFSMYFGGVFQKSSSWEAKQYLISHSPIGARDRPTLVWLQNQGIPSYFSASATLLIGNPFPATLVSIDEIVVVDVNERALELVVPDEYRWKIVKIPQVIDVSDTYQSRMARYHYSYSLIMRLARAKLVVTSHVHTALPCVSMDTPVIFVETDWLPGVVVGVLKDLQICFTLRKYLRITNLFRVW